MMSSPKAWRKPWKTFTTSIEAHLHFSMAGAHQRWWPVLTLHRVLHPHPQREHLMTLTLTIFILQNLGILVGKKRVNGHHLLPAPSLLPKFPIHTPPCLPYKISANLLRHLVPFHEDDDINIGFESLMEPAASSATPHHFTPNSPQHGHSIALMMLLHTPLPSYQHFNSIL